MIHMVPRSHTLGAVSLFSLALFAMKTAWEAVVVVLALLQHDVVVANKARISSTCVRSNVDQCGFLMNAHWTTAADTDAANDSEDCDCYDFCQGQFVGCGGGEDSAAAGGNDHHESSEWVWGCTIDDMTTTTVAGQKQQDEAETAIAAASRSLQSSTIYVGQTVSACPAGTFCRGVGAVRHLFDLCLERRPTRHYCNQQSSRVPVMVPWVPVSGSQMMLTFAILFN
jgi:hypothetical protein